MEDSTSKGRWCNLPYYLLALAALMASAAAATFYFNGGAVGQRSLHAEGTTVTLYPTGDANQDLLAMRDAVANYELIKLARNDASGSPKDFVLTDTSATDAVLKLVTAKPTVVQALDAANPPVLKISGAAGVPGLLVNASGAEVELRDLIIESSGPVEADSYASLEVADVSLTVAQGGGSGLVLGASAGDALVRDSSISSHSGTETYALGVVGTAGDVNIISNDLTGAEPLKLSGFSSHVTAIDNDLIVNSYTHAYIIAIGVDVVSNTPESSALLNRNRILFDLPSAPTTVLANGLYFPQALFGVLAGNGPRNYGAYNVDIQDLTVDSEYAVTFGAIFGKTAGSSVNKLAVNAEMVGYDFTALGLASWAIQELMAWPLYQPTGSIEKSWEYGLLPVGLVPAADVGLLNKAHDNTIVSTGQSQYTVFDASEYTATAPGYAAWLAEGNNAAVLDDWGYDGQFVWQITCQPYNAFVAKLLCTTAYASAPFCQSVDWASVSCELTGQPPVQFADESPSSYTGDNDLVGNIKTVSPSAARKPVNPSQGEDTSNFNAESFKGWEKLK